MNAKKKKKTFKILFFFKNTIVRNFYPAISTFAIQICYTNKLLLYSY